MNDSLEISFSWLPGEYGDPADRATLAEIGIAVDGYVATELEDLLAKTVRPVARLSAFRLASWLASNWWRLRWEPEREVQSWRMSHRMGAAGGGYAWPDLTFSSDGSTVRARARATEPNGGDPVRYLADFDVVIRAETFEEGVGAFIDTVIGRLVDRGVNEPGLALLWREVCEERRDPERSEWRKLEAMLGYDPGEAPDDLVSALEGRMNRFGKGSVEEIAASSCDSAPNHLARFAEAEESPALAVMTIPNGDSLRERVRGEVDPRDYPWRRAEQAAAIARSVWSLATDRISTGEISELLSIDPLILEDGRGEAALPLPAGFRRSGNGERVAFALNKRWPTPRRFALARLVGDHLDASAEERLLPATPVKTARQKFQRTFAQELLCPFGSLMEYLRNEWPANETSEDAIEDAAGYFDVSPLLVRTTLVNKDLLARDALAL